MLRKTSYVLALVLLCGVGHVSTSLADEPRFIARLPQGTVELVGVTNDLAHKKSHWWRPDGSAASIGPFRPSLLSFYRTPADEKLRMFLLRFENLPVGTPKTATGGISSSTTPEWPPPEFYYRNWLSGSGGTKQSPGRYPIPGSETWEFFGSDGAVDARGAPATNYSLYIFSGAPDRADTHSRNDKTAPDRYTYPRDDKAAEYFYHVLFGRLRASALTTDLRIGISMGAWETVISQKPPGGKSSFSREGREWTVTIQKKKMSAEQSASTTRFVVTSLYTCGLWNKRLVAVASDGSEHATSIGVGTIGLPGDVGEALFVLPLSSIKELRLQVRPYHWVEFHNISLQPGQKTNVEIVSPDAPADTEK